MWLPYGELTRLLRWHLPGGRAMELLGKTFHQTVDGDVTSNEWFGQFVIKHGQATVLDVSADQDNLGTMRVVLDGQVAEPMPGELVYTSETHHQVKFTVSQTPDNDQFTVDGRRGRRLKVEAGGMKMTIHMAKASKFKKERDRVKWARLHVFKVPCPASPTCACASTHRFSSPPPRKPLRARAATHPCVRGCHPPRKGGHPPLQELTTLAAHHTHACKGFRSPPRLHLGCPLGPRQRREPSRGDT